MLIPINIPLPFAILVSCQQLGASRVSIYFRMGKFQQKSIYKTQHTWHNEVTRGENVHSLRQPLAQDQHDMIVAISGFLWDFPSGKLAQSVISDFCLEADENCVLLGHYAASSGNSLPTFRDYL